VIDIILGDVFVVVAKFLATEVVTLRCNRVSDMFRQTNSVTKALIASWQACGNNVLVATERWSRIGLARPVFTPRRARYGQNNAPENEKHSWRSTPPGFKVETSGISGRQKPVHATFEAAKFR
jgi:hypothetical protein